MTRISPVMTLNRVRIIEAIKSEDGITHKQLALTVGLSESTVDYHAHRLKQAGYLTRSLIAGEVRYYSTVSPRPETERVMNALGEDKKPVIHALQRIGSMSAARIARETGMPVGVVRWVLEQAMRLNLVRKDGKGAFAATTTGASA